MMLEIVDSRVFPFLRTLGVDGSTYSQHMEGARFTVPTAGLLVKAVDMLSDIPMRDRDNNGDLYEYMLGKIASAGSSGQFRTPRHIIGLMVEMTAPGPQDESVTRLAAPGGSWSPRLDDCQGSAGHREDQEDRAVVPGALPAPVQAGRSGGDHRADGVLFGSSKAHKELRRMLVEEQQLKAVVKLPSGVFNPYAGVSTAILFFIKTNSGGTDNVWFYDVQANGMSLDYKRTPCWRRTSSARCRPVSSTRAITRRTTCRTAQSGGRTGSAQSGSASGPARASASPRPTSSPSKEAVHNETEHRDPGEIIADLESSKSTSSGTSSYRRASLGASKPFRSRARSSR